MIKSEYVRSVILNSSRGNGCTEEYLYYAVKLQYKTASMDDVVRAVDEMIDTLLDDNLIKSTILDAKEKFWNHRLQVMQQFFPTIVRV